MNTPCASSVNKTRGKNENAGPANEKLLGKGNRANFGCTLGEVDVGKIVVEVNFLEVEERVKFAGYGGGILKGGRGETDPLGATGGKEMDLDLVDQIEDESKGMSHSDAALRLQPLHSPHEAIEGA